MIVATNVKELNTQTIIDCRELAYRSGNDELHDILTAELKRRTRIAENRDMLPVDLAIAS